jgi:predicted molibdopterin-dependent oxidoreductase YjgC
MQSKEGKFLLKCKISEAVSLKALFGLFPFNSNSQKVSFMSTEVRRHEVDFPVHHIWQAIDTFNQIRETEKLVAEPAKKKNKIK